jgi:signal transduction histidine kinase
VALRVRLALAVDRTDGDEALARVLTQLGSDLEAALADLRGIAGELYPPLLADDGLPAAVRAAVRHAGVSPSRLRSEAVGRYPQEVEAAVYFTLEEVVTAAAETPEGAASVRILLSERAGLLSFEFAWDGVLPPAGDDGLAGTSALVRAVGGHVELARVPSGGQTVAGAVPVAGPAGRRDRPLVG